MRLTDDAERTYKRQDYSGDKASIFGIEIVELRRFHDDSGSMTELVRLSDGLVPGLTGFRPIQVNYATLAPGAVKAFHVHRRQTDVWYVPPEDRVLVVLLDVREASPSRGTRMRFLLGDTRSALLRIPPGVAHGCRNLGSAPARILYLTDVHFSPDPETTDEGRLPWDFIGSEIWEMSRE